MKLLELAERCERATGPDRELDRCLFAVLHGVERERRTGPMDYPPTASLDAAMTLVPDGAGLDAAGERFRLEGWTTNGVHAPHVRATAWVAGARRVYAATPALALCAAALRARAASAGETRRAETGTGSAEDEHATGEAGDAQ